jgi:cytochrome c553
MSIKSFKTGEKVLFGFFGALVIFAVISYVLMEVYRVKLNHPIYPQTTSFNFTPEGKTGSVLFRTKGCPDCHRAVRNGTNNGLSLDGLGSRKTVAQIQAFLKNPEANYPSKTFDHGPGKDANYVAALPEQEIQDISIFLSQLKAVQGSPDARIPMPEKSGFVDEMVKMWAPAEWQKDRHDLRDDAHQK